jgi:hypothetical protein
MEYSKDGAFNDPVLRCDSCATLVFKEDLLKVGSCINCGSRKVRNVQIIKPEEMNTMKHRNVDPDFIALFEEVEVGE